MTPEIPAERFEVFATGLDHPECVAFDRDGWLWAGGEAGQVYRVSPEGAVATVVEVGGFSGGLAWTPDDSELFVCNPRHGVLRVARSGKWQVFAASAGSHRMVCPNFGLFDSRGDYWVTDSGAWQRNNGFLLKYDSSGRGEIVAGPFGYVNGLALAAGERTMYMAESDRDRIWRIDLAGGPASVLVEGVGRLPDGLALDADGTLYASCYASDDIHRIAPTGEVALYAHDRWAMLLSRPTNLAFQDGFLYVANLGRTTVTRARVGVEGQRLANQR